MEKETKEFLEKLNKSTVLDHMNAFREIKKMTFDRLQNESNHFIEQADELRSTSCQIVEFLEKVVKP